MLKQPEALHVNNKVGKNKIHNNNVPIYSTIVKRIERVHKIKFCIRLTSVLQ